MVLINIFSNIWFYISDKTINHKEDNINYKKELQILKRIQTYQNIDKLINIDQETNYWNTSVDFHPEIKANILLDKQNALHKTYHKLLLLIKKKIQYPDENILLYSIENRECLLGFYIYLLKKSSDMNLQSGLIALKSKLGDITYNFSDLMTKYLLSNM